MSEKEIKSNEELDNKLDRLFEKSKIENKIYKESRQIKKVQKTASKLNKSQKEEE